MTSLSRQLAHSASLNTALLVDRSRRKSPESYLFTGRDAHQHDLHAIHALGINGLLQLASLDPAFLPFEDKLFSDHAKSIDRTLLSSEASAELDQSIDACLSLLGPYLIETPTAKVIEWLVRRFRINEFNVEAILSLFLPYHESPHFAKMLTILHIKLNSTWSFLHAFKSAAQHVPRISLVTEMLRNLDVARFVSSLLPSAMKEGRCHRVLLAFNAACLHDFIFRSQSLDEGTLAYLLPALLEPLQQVPAIKDAVLGSYVLLSTLSQKCQFKAPALKAIVGAMAACAQHVSPRQFINAAVSVCELQTELEHWSDSTVKNIIRISTIGEELRNSCKWFGSEKLLCPLLPGLLKRLGDENALSLLEDLLTAPQVPTIVIRRSANMLIRCAISEEALPDATSARRLLSIIKQRHPTAFNEAADVLREEDADVEASVEQLIISLSVVPTTHDSSEDGRKGNVDMILASSNADAKVRAIAVKGLLDSISKQLMDPAELEYTHSALLARVQDTNQSVVEALYNEPNVIVPILIKEASTYVTSLSTLLSAPGVKPKRALLRTHLNFIGTHLFPTGSSYLHDIFHQILLPFLLFSKPRQHTAEVVWETVSNYLQGVDVKRAPAYEWLAGCASIINAEKQKENVDPVERMSTFNLAIAAQIAKNILMSNNYAAHFDALVVKLQDINPHSKVLSYLITRALLGQLSGEHQLEAAHRVLDVAGIEDLPSGGDNLFDAIDDKTLGRNIVVKPSNKNTLHWLQISILAFVATMPRPQGLTINWIMDDSSASSDKRGPRYVGLMRTIYRLANMSTSAPRLTMNLLQTLFINLKDDALAFLAGIWINCTPKNNNDDLLVTVALRHAVAFLEAHIAEDGGMDFQTIFPAFLVALQSESVDIRQAALACISCLRRLADRQFTAVYRFDTIYGQSENQLQYLDRDDFKRYLEALGEHQDHLAPDVEHVKLFHEQHLSPNKTDKKRNAEYKHRVLCYMLSHINALGIPSAQVALLKTVQSISDSAKAQVLLPTIQMLLSGGYRSNSPSADLSDLVISCFDISTTDDLNNDQSKLWDTFLAVLRSTFTSGFLSSSRSIISQALGNGLFAKLRLERTVTICETLLDVSSRDAETYAASKQVLSNLVQDVPLIVRMLDSLQPNPIGTSPRASKRARLVDAPEDGLQRLGLFVEVLGTRPLHGSLDLVSHLLETLNRVVQSVSPVQADVSYVEQLLMSAIENSASKIKEMPNLSPSAVRLDILVELIRVADNPQTFHQALLLMANLARLAPDSVLCNVMPVFTFMGSNVFHRDDTYSFRVVQQTIDNIVPVMVSSLKHTHSETLSLWIGSKDFLRVFTDAANHIPRHRRTSFFTHLVDVLGSEDFLAPICMLLIEKVANRVVRQTSEEVQNSLVLPSSILDHNSPELQIRTLTGILHECQRLAARITHPEIVQPTFLEVPLDDEHSAPLSTVLRRRAQALAIFVGYAVKPSTSESSSHQEHVNHLMTALIALSTLESGANADAKVDEISQAARASMDRALRVMSVVDFANAVLSMIESGEQQVQAGALELLSDRLAEVSTKMRQNIVPTMVKITDAIRNLLVAKTDAVAPSAFRALRSIGLNLSPGEESSLTNTICPILAAIRERTLASWALAALSPLPSKLGPRIIPYFREIIALCVAVLREGTTGVGDAQSTLLGLLSSIPSFWGTAELEQVVVLYLDHCATSSSPSALMASLMKSVAKRAPSKVLLPAMIELWPSLKTSEQVNRFVAYFDLLARALRNASRTEVLEQLRTLFTVFLEAFDIAKVPSGTSTDAEFRAIAAFREFVVKLNDAAFRPLFRRLYDWAFADINYTARKISFCHLYSSLLDLFKSLMVPYMSFLLEPFISTLQAFSGGTKNNQTFWACILETVNKSLSFDDGVFWRDDKLRQLASPLIEQVAVCIRSNYTEGRSLLQECLSALVDSVTDDALLKSINLNMLMHTRSDDVRLRILALTCSENLWRSHGGKLLGFLAETTTFIAECSEDENDMVVRESFRLKDAVESVAGNITGL